MKRYALFSEGYGPASIYAEDDEEAMTLACSAGGKGTNTKVYLLLSGDAPINQNEDYYLGTVTNAAD